MLTGTVIDVPLLSGESPVTLSGDESATFEVLIGSVCTITETSSGGAVTTFTESGGTPDDAADGVVVFSADASLVVTNTWDVAPAPPTTCPPGRCRQPAAAPSSRSSSSLRSFWSPASRWVGSSLFVAATDCRRDPRICAGSATFVDLGGMCVRSDADPAQFRSPMLTRLSVEGRYTSPRWPMSCGARR